MRGRLSVILMVLVALSLVLSLVAALAPGAIAQDSEAAPDGSAKWMRYRMPSAQDIEAAITSGFVDGQPRNCCITVEGPYPKTITPTNPCSLYGSERPNRWFCVQYYQ